MKRGTFEKSSGGKDADAGCLQAGPDVIFWRCIDENIMDEEAFRSTSMMNTCFGKGCGDSVYVDDIDKRADLW